MITSKQNDKIKLVCSLRDKKSRDQLGLYLAEGVKSVEEARKKSALIVEIFATEKGAELLSEKDGVTLVSNEVFAKITDQVSPQGVIALIKKPNLELRSPKNRALFLDGVSDPSNVGAIIRTAAATGYLDVYLTSNSADAFSPKAVRASMSGIFLVNVFVRERKELLEVIDCPIYVADMNGEDVFSFKAEKRHVLVIGNEANGVSTELKNLATNRLSIPMENDIESLNAGVSAGVIMYALKKS